MHVADPPADPAFSGSCKLLSLGPIRATRGHGARQLNSELPRNRLESNRVKICVLVHIHVRYTVVILARIHGPCMQGRGLAYNSVTRSLVAQSSAESQIEKSELVYQSRQVARKPRGTVYCCKLAAPVSTPTSWYTALCLWQKMFVFASTE